MALDFGLIELLVFLRVAGHDRLELEGVYGGGFI